MACFVRILESLDSEELVEIPTEDDGTLLLSSVSAQFPDAVGLRYKSESGCWRGVRLQDNIMKSPAEGWGDFEYYVIKKKALKREAEDNDDGPNRKLNKMTDDDVGPSAKLNKIDISEDLMIANLPFSATEAEVRSHFESFGELDLCEIKFNNDGKSRGFGFIRYKTVEAVEAALAETHTLNNRKCELRYSKRSQGLEKDKEFVLVKLFIGRIPRGTTTTELEKHFSQYGAIKDVYIPSPPRGYGFVTYDSQNSADKALNDSHVIKGRLLNVTYPNEKRMYGMFDQSNSEFGNMQGGGFGNMQGGGLGNMQGGGLGNMQGGGLGNMQGGGLGNMQGGGFGNMQGGGFGNIQGRSFGNVQGGFDNMQANRQMGNRQNNMSNGMNAKPDRHNLGFSVMQGGGFSNMQDNAHQMGNRQNNMSDGMNARPDRRNQGFSAMQGGGFGSMQGNLHQMGNGQNSMSDGINAKPSGQVKVQTQNGSPSVGPQSGNSY